MKKDIDPYQKQFEESVIELRNEPFPTAWERGVPIAYITVSGQSWKTMCNILPEDRFQCAFCKEEQPIHEGRCNKCATKIEIKIDRWAWNEDLHLRIRHLYERETKRTMGS